MNANLHLHSRYSDGSLWPEEIAERASGLGLGLVALTDHDTLGGVPEFLAACRSRGLAGVAACEIDCAAPSISYRSELLAYFPGAEGPEDYPATEALLRGVSARRARRLKHFIERSRLLFRCPELSFEELLERKLAGRIGEPGPSTPEGFRPEATRLDLAAVSLNKVDLFYYLKAHAAIDPASSYREFKRAYFETGLISDGRFPRLLAAEAAKAVRADGGFLVLPHPGHEFDDDPERLRRDPGRLRELLLHLRGLGVSGVELYYYRNEGSAELNELVRRAATELGFFFTYGSDCHGPGTEKETLGLFSGDFEGFPQAPTPHTQG